MSYGLPRTGLVMLALGGAWATGLAITRPLVRVELPAPSALPRQAARRAAPPPVRGDVFARPVFRADRRAPSGRYDPNQALMPDVTPAPPVPKPALTISGVVWGDEPAALVDGVPGIEGSTVLRPGESAAGLRVVRIQGDKVVIQGMDTTWQLTVRELWR